MDRSQQGRFSLVAVILLVLIHSFMLTSCSKSQMGGGDTVTLPPPPPTYTVTYDNNNTSISGSVPVDANAYEEGQTVTVLGNTGNLVRPGYTFIGWNAASDGTGTTYTERQTFVMGTSNVILYATWTTNPTYTVTYDGNSNTGGIVPVDSANYQQGQTVVVLGNTSALVRTGYSFVGWNTLANGTGTAYTQGQTFAMGSANVTLYAQWTANPTYTVTYSGNSNTSGSVPIDTTAYETGKTVTILGNTGNVARTGYLFLGWNTQADGKGTTYVQAQTFVMGSANVTLYAKWTWTKQLGVAGAATEAKGVAVDGSGNIYVAGYTGGGLDGNVLTGAQDFFLTRYNAAGSRVSTTLSGTAGAYTQANSVAVDGSGNVYVAGYTTGGLDGNTVSGQYDFFVTTYSSAGNKVRTRQLGAAIVSITQANSVAVDGSGNVYVAGYTNGNLDGITISGAADSFLTKYNAAGNKLSTTLSGTAGKDTIANSVAVDGSGNVYVAGSTTGGLDGNTMTGAKDLFLTKYDLSGAFKYTKQLGVAGKSTVANCVAVDVSGNVYVAGYTNGGLDSNTLTGTYDLFVTKYDSAGIITYTRQLGAAGGVTQAFGVAVDGSGNVYVAGSTTGLLDGNTLTGMRDYFLTMYDPSGNKVRTKQLGAPYSAPGGSPTVTQAYGVAVDGSKNVYVTGSTDGGMEVNALTGTQDFFLTKYDPAGNKQ